MTTQPQRLRLSRPIVSFDLETTGLDIGSDKVVEICCVKLHVDGSREILTRRLNPGRPIAPQATAVHGITDADVADCPRFEQAAAALHAFFAGSDLTGFNIEHFDLPFLANEFGRAGFSFPAADAHVIDTFRIFTMREPRDLSAALRLYCARELTDAHQAEADALAAADVLLAQVERYSDLPCDVAGLHSVCRPPDWLDGQGKIVWCDDEAVVSFGKHKGKSLRVLADTEASYMQWMCRDNKFAPDTMELIKAALRGQFPSRVTAPNVPDADVPDADVRVANVGVANVGVINVGVIDVGVADEGVARLPPPAPAAPSAPTEQTPQLALFG